MKIGAYQFCVTSDIRKNYKTIENAIIKAAEQKVDLLAFPECALTGYPPNDIPTSSVVDFARLESVYVKLQELSNLYNIMLIVGTITVNGNSFYNSAMIFSPYEEKRVYNKRALWGWDKDNFKIGEGNGIVEINGWKIGVRICFEVRFPEFFRELYIEQTDLNVILFYDVSDYDNIQRYQMINSHIMTRAVENVTYTLSVNTMSSFQTAPTILLNRSGSTLEEIERNKEGLLMYDLEKKELDSGELGRKEVSDWLIVSK